MAEALQGQWSDLRRGPQLIQGAKSYVRQTQAKPAQYLQQISCHVSLLKKKKTIKIGTTNSGLAEISAGGSTGMDS